MNTTKKKNCSVSEETLMQELSNETEVICACCGARSSDKDHVCEPVAIEPDH